MRLLTLILLFYGTETFGQKEQYNWYFGKFAAMSFETGKAEVKYDNPFNIYGKCASVSDPATGKLLLYTDGNLIWNSSHKLIRNGNLFSAVNGDIMFMPLPGSTSLYYMFFIGSGGELNYVIIDVTANNGSAEVISTIKSASSQNGAQIAIIRHQYADAFWVITHENANNRFRCHYTDKNGVSSQPVVSDAGLSADMYGDMTGSNKGDKLAVTHFYGNGFKAEVFDFDRVCGKVSKAVVLDKLDNWDHAYGIVFSPDDSKLYVAYGVATSQLVQYHGTDYTNNYFIAQSPHNFNIMRLAPDGIIYNTTHDNGIPGARINAILKPNELGVLCSFRETYLKLDEGRGSGRAAQFELPAFASGKQVKSPVADSIFNYQPACEGDLTKFRFNTANVFDSLLWNFGDGSAGSKDINPDHKYTKGGHYQVSLNIYRCGNNYILTDTIKIDSFPETGFIKDTMICYGDTLFLGGPKAQKYLWSTGETSQNILQHKTGKTWLISGNGNCNRKDSINISNHPDIITKLGSEYFICEDDEELVKLDAGEGFNNYKWFPTEDTTQWIIVKNTGDYFVKVTDNSGCNGNSKSRVKRRCGVLLFFPNSFTPNNDGLNEIYAPVGNDVVSYRVNIYNTWGQLVFTSQNVNKGWDGTSDSAICPTGVYVYEAEYSGYRNKRLQQFSTKGNLTLLR